MGKAGSAVRAVTPCVLLLRDHAHSTPQRLGGNARLGRSRDCPLACLRGDCGDEANLRSVIAQDQPRRTPPPANGAPDEADS
jgi:hypothetical protein